MASGISTVDHVAMFPQYAMSWTPTRKLAWIEDNKIIMINTGKVVKFETPDEFVNAIFKENALCYLKSFNAQYFPFEYLDYFIRTGADVTCNRYGHISCIHIRRGNRVCWITSLQSWHFDPNQSNMLSMFQLKEVFENANIGCYPTPSSLAMNIMVRGWPNKNGKPLKHSVPNGFCTRHLNEIKIGGRVDTYANMKRTYGVADYYDMAAAHPSKFIGLPTGTTLYIYGEEGVENMAYSVSKCTVVVHEDLPLGPFPVRDDNGKVYYPREKGTYIADLSKGRIEDARKAGCDVQVGAGWGWLISTDDSRYYRDETWRLREQDGGEIKRIFKLVSNSGIGRQGNDGSYMNMVLKDSGNIDEELSDILRGHAVLLPYAIRKTVNDNSVNMIHWYYYVTDETAREVYHNALPFAERDMLLSINFDGFVTKSSDKINHMGYREKGSSDIQMGETTWERLTNVRFPYSRAIVCDQFSKRPGTLKEGVTRC